MPPPAAAVPALAAADRPARLEALRDRVRAIERAGAARPGRVLRLGVEAVDGALPEGGLALGAVHQIGGAGEADAMGAATGFCLALLRRLVLEAPPGADAVLWCTAGDDLYAPGLAGFGLGPERLLVLRARRREDRLWAMAEGLGCPALAAVVCEARPPGPLQGRRLQLAAERGGVTGFLLHRPEAAPGRGDGAGAASHAATRWRLSAVPGAAPEAGGPGAPRWRVALLRCRGGLPRSWVMEWDHGTDGFRLAAASGHGSSGPASLPADRRSA